MDGEISRAIVRRDLAILDALVSNGYTHTNPLGEVFSKQQIAGAIESGGLAIASYETDDVVVRLFRDAAVVTGRARISGQLRGQDVTGQAAATQLTGISAQQG